MNGRRIFIKRAIKLGAVATIAPQFIAGNTAYAESLDRDGNGFTFLFQGDSITDAGRSKDQDWNHIMGQGYAYLISSRLWLDNPDKKFQFFNRGVGGSKLTEMAGRWQTDAIDLKPDLISLLIGINDVSAMMRGDVTNTAEKFESDYRALLQQTRHALPRVQLVIGEPFVFPGTKIKDKYADYVTEIKKRQDSVRRLSLEFNAIFIPYQSLFNQALAIAPIEYWVWDGIHPMPAGHELMAREWIKQVKKVNKFIR